MKLMPDHVHLLLEVDPQFGIHKAIKRIKGVSSRILRQEFKELCTKLPTLWSNSYFVSTVGGAPLEVIKQYIENQKTSQRQEISTRKRKTHYDKDETKRVHNDYDADKAPSNEGTKTSD